MKKFNECLRALKQNLDREPNPRMITQYIKQLNTKYPRLQISITGMDLDRIQVTVFVGGILVLSTNMVSDTKAHEVLEEMFPIWENTAKFFADLKKHGIPLVFEYSEDKGYEIVNTLDESDRAQIHFPRLKLLVQFSLEGEWNSGDGKIRKTELDVDDPVEEDKEIESGIPPIYDFDVEDNANEDDKTDEKIVLDYINTRWKHHIYPGFEAWYSACTGKINYIELMWDNMPIAKAMMKCTASSTIQEIERLIPYASRIAFYNTHNKPFVLEFSGIRGDGMKMFTLVYTAEDGLVTKKEVTDIELDEILRWRERRDQSKEILTTIISEVLDLKKPDTSIPLEAVDIEAPREEIDYKERERMTLDSFIVEYNKIDSRIQASNTGGKVLLYYNLTLVFQSIFEDINLAAPFIGALIRINPIIHKLGLVFEFLKEHNRNLVLEIYGCKWRLYDKDNSKVIGYMYPEELEKELTKISGALGY